MTRGFYTSGAHARTGLVAFVACLAACTFQIDGVLVGTPIPDLSQEAEDLAGVDLAGLCRPGGATSACSSDQMSLLTCDGSAVMAETCSNGCSPNGSAPHCRLLDPSGVAEPSDYLLADLQDLNIDRAVTFYTGGTNGGQVSGLAIPRAAGPGVVQGIGYRLGTQKDGTQVAIFSMLSLTVNMAGQITVVGSLPLILVTKNAITIQGVVDVQGSCIPNSVTAGGGMGGSYNVNAGLATGPGGGGGGVASNATSGGGGGGGGFGDVGGAGGSGSTTSGAGAGGLIFGDLTMHDGTILVGGGGGGAGGNLGGAGGSGGGALQLASNGPVIIDSSGLVNAGGCHGNVSGDPNGAGGGGGAGGAILIEGSDITLNVNSTSAATIIAGGGAGAGGGSGTAGDDATQTGDVAMGGKGGTGSAGTTKGGDGGSGGAAGTLKGGDGQQKGKFGGGGGGGVGRITLNSKSGAVNTMNVTIVPGIGDKNSAGKSPATIGTAQYE